MDYQTKPTSRHDLRKYAKYFRQIFNVAPNGPFPVLHALEKINDVFTNCSYEIVEDSQLPPKTMAQCSPNFNGGFSIEIKESVYQAAYEKKSGACLGFIFHEICHLFLFHIGFMPIYARSVE